MVGRLPGGRRRRQRAGELIEDGTDGMLVPREDAAGLAAALGAVLAEPARARAMAAAGRRRYEAEFTETRVLALWRDFLGSVGSAA